MLLRKPHILCGLMIMLALVSGQLDRLHISSGLIFQVLSYAKYFASAGIIAYAAARCQKSVLPLQLRRSYDLFMPLIILMIAVELIAVAASPVPRIFGLRYYTRMVSRFLDRLCIICTVIAIWSVSNEKTVGAIVKVLLLDQLLILLAGTVQVGLGGIIESIVGAFSLKEGTSNIFEVHELTFTIGLVILYYLFLPKYTRKNACILAVLLLAFLLGAKRIGIAALGVAGIFALVIKKRGLSKTLLTLIGCVGVVICFAYLFMIYDDRFFAILSKLGINNMGRDLIFGYFTRRTSLKPTQLGWGMAGVSKMIENMDRAEVLYMQAVRGLHNDILQVYINYGFFGSLCWFALNLVYIPRKLYSFFGRRNASMYMAMAVYMFITYLTDNTEGYYTCQIVFFLLPMIVVYQVDDNSRKKLNRKA